MMTIEEILKEQIELQRQHLKMLAKYPDLDITGELKKQSALVNKGNPPRRFRLDA